MYKTIVTMSTGEQITFEKRLRYVMMDLTDHIGNLPSRAVSINDKLTINPAQIVDMKEIEE